MSDIIGPANAANAVTVRPAETRSFLALDTWFKDCSGPLADDGTNVEASWLNGMLAWSRAIWRGNGNRLDGITPVVPEVGTDDAGVLKAIQHLIQRGQILYADDTSSTPNILLASLNPALVEYKKGLTVAIAAANTNTGISVLNLNNLGYRTIVRPNGVNLFDSDIVAGSVNTYRYDGYRFQLIGATSPPRLARNTTIYVNGAIGNDANDGTSNDSVHALATIQAAINLAWSYQPSQYAITIQIAQGTYTGAVTPIRPGPSIIIDGINGSVTVNNTPSGSCLHIQGPNNGIIRNLMVSSYGPVGGGAAILSSSGASLRTENTSSGYCGGAVFEALQGGTLEIGSHVWWGNCYALMWAGFGGISLTSGASYSIATPITVTVASAFTTGAGNISVPNPNPPVWYNSGYVSGPKYLCITNGNIGSQGLGVNWFPGSIAGSTSSGGQYV